MSPPFPPTPPAEATVVVVVVCKLLGATLCLFTETQFVQMLLKGLLRRDESKSIDVQIDANASVGALRACVAVVSGV